MPLCPCVHMPTIETRLLCTGFWACGHKGLHFPAYSNNPFLGGSSWTSSTSGRPASPASQPEKPAVGPSYGHIGIWAYGHVFPWLVGERESNYGEVIQLGSSRSPVVPSLPALPNTRNDNCKSA